MNYKGFTLFLILAVLLVIIYLKGYTHVHPKGEVDVLEEVEIGVMKHF